LFFIVLLELYLAVSFFDRPTGGSDAAGNGMAKGFAVAFLIFGQVEL